MLQCHPQMSGIDSGPSAVTMRKWSRKQRQDWQQKEKRRRQRETTAHAAVGANRAVAAQNPGAPHSDTALGCCQLTLPSLRYAASSPRTPATKQTRRDSPDSPSSPNPSQTKRREHGDIAPVPGVEEEKPTGASENQATTLVAADCTGANADATAGSMHALSEGLASLSTAGPAPATTKVHSALTPPLLPRRLTDIRRLVMRCGYNRDTTPREEGSARRGSYWAALGANYSPIGGRQGILPECAHLGLVAGTCS
jgi:hypothetical protein